MSVQHFIALQQILALAGASPDIGPKKKHEEYVKNFIRICNYTSAVNNSHIPRELTSYVRNWEEYNKCLCSAKGLALNWSNYVINQLICYPRGFIQEYETIEKIFDRMLRECDDQIDDPDPEGQKHLASDIHSIRDSLKTYFEYIDILMDRMEHFNTSLATQTQMLEQIITLSVDDMQVDQKKVNELMQHIANVNRQVDILTEDLIRSQSSGFTPSACIAGVGIVLLFMQPITGGLAVVIAGGMLAMYNAQVISVNRANLSMLQADIERSTESMNQYTIAIATLQAMNDQFARLTEETQNIKESMAYLLDVWLGLEDDLKKIADELTDADHNMTENKWLELKKDVIWAKMLWKKFLADSRVALLDGLAANDCMLKLGMSESEIAEAIDKGEKKSIMWYVLIH